MPTTDNENKNENTPEPKLLHSAIDYCQYDQFWELVERGIDLTVRDGHGNSILDRFITYRRIGDIEKLLAKGVKFDAESAKQIVICYLNPLLENPSSLNLVQALGLLKLIFKHTLITEFPKIVNNLKTALYSNYAKLFFYAIENTDYCDVIQGLLALNVDGVNVNMPLNTSGLTPLMYAAQHSNKVMVDFLIANGADLTKQTIEGETALEYALRMKDKHPKGLEICQKLIEIQQIDAISTFLSAAEAGKKDIVEYFITNRKRYLITDETILKVLPNAYQKNIDTAYQCLGVDINGRQNPLTEFPIKYLELALKLKKVEIPEIRKLFLDFYNPGILGGRMRALKNTTKLNNDDFLKKIFEYAREKPESATDIALSKIATFLLKRDSLQADFGSKVKDTTPNLLKQEFFKNYKPGFFGGSMKHFKNGTSIDESKFWEQAIDRAAREPYSATAKAVNVMFGSKK